MAALDDYSQLLRAYPNANKFLEALKSSVAQHLPSQEDLRDPRKMMDVALNFGPSNLASGLAGVIKAKGGNWLDIAGDIGRDVERMKLKSGLSSWGDDPEALVARMREQYSPEELTYPTMQSIISDMGDRTAVNNWLQTKFAKYVQNEMGTPEDPVRALAEKGVLHFDPLYNRYIENLASETREKAGQSYHPIADTELGRRWENIADASIVPFSAKKLKELDLTSSYPWLEKIDPETMVFSPALNKETLGVDHLTDELYNAIRKESDLPEHLRLDPSKLSKISMPQAVELVDKINKYRAAEIARANLEKSRNAATVLHKDYPEQGLSWVELKHMPDADPDMKALKDALTYEGQVMGHCVGGYCPEVASGQSRIFSLRDTKGEPHVTIETRPGIPKTFESFDEYNVLKSLTPNEFAQYYSKVDDPNLFGLQSQLKAADLYDTVVDRLGINKEPLPIIQQIKGKQNKTPIEQYIPAVQDFVRSNKWSDIYDQYNTGLSSNELNSLLDKPKFAQGGEIDLDRIHSIINDFHQGEYGLRHDAETEKGRGYLNELKRPDGNVMTEYSIGVPIDGVETDIPTLVPELTIDEIKSILSMPEGGKIPKSIVKKAQEHAIKRVKEGKSVFATPEESEFGER